MKLSVFFVLLPSVAAFMVPVASPPCRSGCARPQQQQQFIASTHQPARRSSITPSMTTQANGGGDDGAWSVSSVWRDVVGSASQTKAKVDSTASDVYKELRKKVLVKKQRQSLESQLCSLIRIESGSMSCKAEEQVRRLACELEALQSNAAAFGSQRTGLAGCWKLIYSSACTDGRNGKSSDRLKSIEDISYVSENCRLSHTDTGVLRVYKRVPSPARAAATYDDTAHSSAALVGSGGGAGGVKKAGRTAATGPGRPLQKQPLRKRMFFGWRR